MKIIDISQSNIIAYKANGTTETRDYIEAESGTYTIPIRKNTKHKWSSTSLIIIFNNQGVNFKQAD